MRQSTDSASLWYGLLGVLGFSLTLPATRLAVVALDPLLVTLARAVGAGFCAMLVLLLSGASLPARHHWRGLVLVAGGVVVGFPLLAAWAMQQVPAAHGAVVVGALPLATALAATWRAGERPSPRFWAASLVGSATVIGFALRAGAGQFQVGDLLLLGAVLAGGVGYAEGGRLARELGGWQVICWALLLALPVLLVPLLLLASAGNLAAPPAAWLGLGYVTLVSQLVAFFAWYRGLALGGVARVGQLQLLQPFLTMGAAALVLGEPVTPPMGIAALVVVGAVWLARNAPVARPALPDVAPSDR